MGYLVPFIAILLLHVLQIGCTENFSTFRSLFTRVANTKLNAATSKAVNNATLESCARDCVIEIGFQCRSFDYDNKRTTCLLFSVNSDTAGIDVETSQERDHYETAYRKLFDRLPNHMLTNQHNREYDFVSVEECSRYCVLETVFKCRGFDYQVATKKCWLTELTSHEAKGVQLYAGVDYYAKAPEGPMSKFTSYGHGQLRAAIIAAGMHIYQGMHIGLNLEECATLCLKSESFECNSFDYHFSSKRCDLSKYIAANVNGLMASYNLDVMHFELMTEYLQYFYATPYTVLLGNNHKTFNKVTPNLCARMCLEETSFICRSFDYQIRDATCLLSSKTGSDVGGLYNQGVMETHHFEMKPSVDCMVNLTQVNGVISSPNWPRNYAHHEHCVWRIKVPENKVIRFKFLHFNIGTTLADTCSRSKDRLEFSEEGHKSFCVLPHTRDLISRTNWVTLTFSSNGRNDFPGFRIMYDAEWPCDVTFLQPSGEFASKNWPKSYPSSTLCSWVIQAPMGHRVDLTFTSFELEQHVRGRCDERFDHVSVHNGATSDSKLIGRYCGLLSPFKVVSSGSAMFVKFFSDMHVTGQGFHAKFEINPPYNDTDASSHGTAVLEIDQKKPTSQYKNELPLFPTKPSNSKETTDKVPLIGSQLQSSADSDTSYKNTLWAIAAVMLVLAVIFGIALFAVCRYYRKRTPRHRILSTPENNDSPEEMPLQDQPIAFEINSLQNNVAFSNPIYGARKPLNGIIKMKNVANDAY